MSARKPKPETAPAERPTDVACTDAESFAPNLATAWLRARRRISPMAKAATAQVRSSKGAAASYSYQFTSSETMVEGCLDALLAEGLTFSLVSWEVGEPLIGYQCPTLWGVFELVFVVDGTTREYRYPMPIASRNDADKAVAGAITYLLGQALRAVLMVPKSGGDDQDPDKRTREYGGHAWGGDSPRGGTRTTTPASKPPAKPAKPEPDKLAPLRAKVRALSIELKDRTSQTWADVARLADLSNPKAPTADDLRKAKAWLNDALDATEGAGQKAEADEYDDPGPPDDWQPTTKPEDDSQAPPDNIDPETGEVLDEAALEAREERAAIQAEANGELGDGAVAK